MNVDLVPIRCALLSVSDKTGLADFARALREFNVKLLSTGGTAKHLRAAGIAVEEISDHTGFPEILDGRVKTLHPRVHGGLLGIRSRLSHQVQMREQGIAPIDMVVVNLYPFREAAARADSTFDELPLEKIQDLRYGENPHQRGALYRLAASAPCGVAGGAVLHGKELSYNNLLDADAAWDVILEFDRPAAAVIKHTNPCGVAQ